MFQPFHTKGFAAALRSDMGDLSGRGRAPGHGWRGADCDGHDDSSSGAVPAARSPGAWPRRGLATALVRPLPGDPARHRPAAVLAVGFGPADPHHLCQPADRHRGPSLRGLCDRRDLAGPGDDGRGAGARLRRSASHCGVLGGYVLGRTPRLAAIFEPYVMAFYGIPKIALAPLFIIWFGIGIVVEGGAGRDDGVLPGLLQRVHRACARSTASWSTSRW